MRVRLQMSARNDPDAALMRLAGWSALAHIVGLVIFSVLPRFMTTPPPRPTLVGEIVPASTLFSPTPRATPSRPAGPTPSERAEAARQAQKEREEKARPPEPKPPAKPKPEKDPSIPPLQPEEKKPSKPSKKEPEPEPAPPPAPPAEESTVPDESGGAEATRQPEPPVAGTDADAGGLSFDTTGMEGGGVPSIGSSSFPYDYYRSSLMTLLQSNWRRPVAPGGLAEPIRCAVGFTILKTGLVKDARVVQPSGNAGLDRSALRAVIDSSPLPPLPFQYGHGAVGAVVFFELTND